MLNKELVVEQEDQSSSPVSDTIFPWEGILKSLGTPSGFLRRSLPRASHTDEITGLNKKK